MKFIVNFFKPDFSYFYKTHTNWGNDVYDTVLTGLECGYSIFNNFVRDIII
ncbi:hypothetical protein [Plasmodium yoelii yoelii]|uniref:Uncharacterized protein n=2 Tax=Plasmodium yoelii TaxID=5861 RepID=Q7RIG9_PLAYO|nr:hypothetical protein [Plasmodium yoelii yoelii]